MARCFGGVSNKVRIAVVDGQGGGIGQSIISRIRDDLSLDLRVLALGTNAVATSRMLKAGANDGASGENAVVVNVAQVDVIIGSINVVLANSMLGELTPAMALAINMSPARKILLPLTRSPVEIVGVTPEPLPHYVDMVIDRLKQILGGEGTGV